MSVVVASTASIANSGGGGGGDGGGSSWASMAAKHRPTNPKKIPEKKQVHHTLKKKLCSFSLTDALLGPEIFGMSHPNFEMSRDEYPWWEMKIVKSQLIKKFSEFPSDTVLFGKYSYEGSPIPGTTPLETFECNLDKNLVNGIESLCAVGLLQRSCGCEDYDEEEDGPIMYRGVGARFK